MDKETSRTIIWVVGIIAATIVLVTFRNSFSESSGPSVPSVPSVPSLPSVPPSPSAPVDMAKLIDDDPMKGQKNAPVTIIEWSDFQCPFCSRFYKDTLPQITKEYIDTGKVKLVYRDFPLSFHPNAKPAAIAAECADAQGKFWQYHDKIFENQAALSPEMLKTWAKDIGLDMQKFDTCVTDPKTAAEVDKDMVDGQSAGISGTPGFLINGRLLSGAQPFASFKAAIDAELAK